MELTYDAAWKEKQRDVRLHDRERAIGHFNEKDNKKILDAIEDCSHLATYANVDDIMANDNPVHVGRNLPSHEPRAPQPFEDLEFEEQASKIHFEH